MKDQFYNSGINSRNLIHKSRYSLACTLNHEFLIKNRNSVRIEILFYPKNFAKFDNYHNFAITLLPNHF